MKPKKELTGKRTPGTAPIWMTADEKAEIQRRAKAKAITVGEYMRHAALNYNGEGVPESVLLNIHDSLGNMVNDLTQLRNYIASHIRGKLR